MTVSAATTVKRTTCYQCTFEAHVGAGRIERLVGPACPRGDAQLEIQYHPDRLRTPLRRVGPRGVGEFTPISWAEVLDKIRDRLLATKAAHGAEAVAFVAGYTKEPRPYLQRLAHAFGSPNFMTETSCCFSATHVAAEVTFGKGYGHFLAGSRANSPHTRCRLVWSNNPEQSQLPYAQHPLLNQPDRRLIVVDPRRTSLAAKADVHLQIRPGTDGALALGLHHVIFANGGRTRRSSLTTPRAWPSFART